MSTLITPGMSPQVRKWFSEGKGNILMDAVKNKRPYVKIDGKTYPLSYPLQNMERDGLLREKGWK